MAPDSLFRYHAEMGFTGGSSSWDDKIWPGELLGPDVCVLQNPANLWLVQGAGGGGLRL